MQTMARNGAGHASAAVGRENADGRGAFVIVCDHASNHVPVEFGSLGLPAAEFERHIAYDIGAEALTRGLAARFGVPAAISRFSRLLIDPNRGLDDPTLIMRLSDGAVVPGNARLDATGREARIDRFYRPYDAAVLAVIEAGMARRATARSMAAVAWLMLTTGVSSNEIDVEANCWK